MGLSRNAAKFKDVAYSSTEDLKKLDAVPSGTGSAVRPRGFRFNSSRRSGEFQRGNGRVVAWSRQPVRQHADQRMAK